MAHSPPVDLWRQLYGRIARFVTFTVPRNRRLRPAEKALISRYYSAIFGHEIVDREGTRTRVGGLYKPGITVPWFPDRRLKRERDVFTKLCKKWGLPRLKACFLPAPQGSRIRVTEDGRLVFDSPHTTTQLVPLPIEELLRICEESQDPRKDIGDVVERTLLDAVGPPSKRSVLTKRVWDPKKKRKVTKEVLDPEGNAVPKPGARYYTIQCGAGLYGVRKLQGRVRFWNTVGVNEIRIIVADLICSDKYIQARLENEAKHPQEWLFGVNVVDTKDQDPVLAKCKRCKRIFRPKKRETVCPKCEGAKRGTRKKTRGNRRRNRPVRRRKPA